MLATSHPLSNLYILDSQSIPEILRRDHLQCILGSPHIQ